MPSEVTLQRFHQVHLSEERLESTIEELTRLEMAAHGFTAALSYPVPEWAAASGAMSAAEAESSGPAARQSSRSSVGLLERPTPSTPSSSSSSIHTLPQEQPQGQQRCAVTATPCTCSI